MRKAPCKNARQSTLQEAPPPRTRTKNRGSCARPLKAPAMRRLPMPLWAACGKWAWSVPGGRRRGGKPPAPACGRVSGLPVETTGNFPAIYRGIKGGVKRYPLPRRFTGSAPGRPAAPVGGSRSRTGKIPPRRGRPSEGRETGKRKGFAPTRPKREAKPL